MLQLLIHYRDGQARSLPVPVQSTRSSAKSGQVPSINEPAHVQVSRIAPDGADIQELPGGARGIRTLGATRACLGGIRLQLGELFGPIKISCCRDCREVPSCVRLRFRISLKSASYPQAGCSKSRTELQSPTVQRHSAHRRPLLVSPKPSAHSSCIPRRSSCRAARVGLCAGIRPANH